MKTKKICGLVLMACLVSAWVMAETSSGKETKRIHKKVGVSASGERKADVPRISPDRQRTSMDRRQAYQERLAKQMAGHRQALAELEAIKKIAEDEGATRTVEAIQRMIDKKDAKFKQKMEQFEHQRHERSKRLQQRTAEKSARKKPVEISEGAKTAERKDTKEK